MNFIIRKIRNFLGKQQGYGGCGKCGGTWDWTQAHYTEYSDCRSCFPLCEKCWSELTPETRLPFYRKLVQEWIVFDSSRRSDLKNITAAVLAGK